MKAKIANPFNTRPATLALAAMIGLGGAQSVQAATYTWTSNTNSTWTTAGNWSTSVAPTNTTAAHRLDILGTGASNAGATYTGAQGTTRYGSSSVRGLAIGLTKNAVFTITGGTFSSLNSTAAGVNGYDALGNSGSVTGTLNVSGGTFIGATPGTCLGFGSGGTGILNVNSGTATITSLVYNSVGTANLDGGTLEVNDVIRTGGSGIFNFNGGTLKARKSTTTFMDGTNVTVNVKNLGAKIDTQAFNITIAGALKEDAGSMGGGLEKSGSGALSLTAVNTYTGATNIKNGSIILGVGNDRLKTTGSVLLGDTSTSGKLVLGDGTARNQTLAGLTTTGNGGSVVGGAGTDSTLTLNIASSNIYGGTLGGGGTNENKLALNKTGEGTLTLTGENTYTGATTIDGGSLALGTGGSIDHSSGVNLINGGNFNVSALSNYSVASLTGNGSVTGDVTVTGALGIGASPGAVIFNDDLTLGASAVSTFEINGFTTGLGLYDLAIGRSGSQIVTFGGTLILNFFGGLDGFNTIGSAKIFDFESYDGDFNLPITTNGLASGYTATFNSDTGFVTVVPEPSAALIGGLGLLCLLRRRR